MPHKWGRKNKLKSNIIVKATILLALFVILSKFAIFSWFFDFFTHFTFHYAVFASIFFIILLFSKRFYWSFLALAIFSYQAYQLYPMLYNSMSYKGNFEQVNLLQFNVRNKNDNIDEIARWITSKADKVDIIVLQEVTPDWKNVLERIKWIYPYNISKQVFKDKELVIFSKFMIDELEIKNVAKREDKDFPTVILRGHTDMLGIPFVLYGVHSPAPIAPSYFEDRNNSLIYAARSIADEKYQHKIMSGDFNMSSYSPWFKLALKESGLYDSFYGTGIKGTWPTIVPNIFSIPIDHSIVSKNIIIDKKEIGPSMGSDHYPMISTMNFYDIDNEVEM